MSTVEDKPSLMCVALATGSRLSRAYITDALASIGASVVVLEKLSEIVERVRLEKPQVLMLSFDLEDLDFETICRMLKSHSETRKVFILGFSSSKELRTDAFKAGAQAFLEFPFTADDLTVTLQQVLIRPKTILLADDTKLIHEYIAAMLKEEPYQILHAYNGKQATELVSLHKPDVVITDLEMPLMNGYELCRWIKQHPTLNRTPVLISSTLSKGVDIDLGFDAGADDYLVKPVEEDLLINKLRMLLQNDLKQQRDLILVVDDSKVIQSMIGNALEIQGFSVCFASDGQEGVQLAKSLHPAMVITDCEMPQMNGRDLARELRNFEEFKHMPILMLTAKESQIEKNKARKAGISEFVSKPFTSDKVLVIVERLLAEAKVLRERDAMMSYMSEGAILQAQGRAKTSKQGVMTAYRDHAAVLFSDICGFTTMSEKRSPEAIITLLNAYFDEMVQIVKVNHGTVDKFIGDAIMAVFSGKTPEDNAYHAVKSGAEMIQKLAELNSRLDNPDDAIHIRIGVNSGPVVFGDLGSRMLRRDFTVIGDNVNTAQRLESKAPKDGVLISDSTYILVKDHVTITDSQSMQLKGKEIRLLCHVLGDVLPRAMKQAS